MLAQILLLSVLLAVASCYPYDKDADRYLDKATIEQGMTGYTVIVHDTCMFLIDCLFLARPFEEQLTFIRAEQKPTTREEAFSIIEAAEGRSNVVTVNTDGEYEVRLDAGNYIVCAGTEDFYFEEGATCGSFTLDPGEVGFLATEYSFDGYVLEASDEIAFVSYTYLQYD